MGMKLRVGSSCRKYQGSQIKQIVPFCNTEYKCVIICELCVENSRKNKIHYQ